MKTYDSRIHAIVTVEPNPIHLLSMAVRFDHGLGIFNYYDHLFGEGTYQAKRDKALLLAKKLYSVVLTHGFDIESQFEESVRCKAICVEPTKDLLLDMAKECKGILSNDASSSHQSVDEDSYMRYLLTISRQMHEEMSGEGFYKRVRIGLPPHPESEPSQ